MGPILGQRVYFEMFAEQRNAVAIDRYRRLTEEAFKVVDARLAFSPWLAGADYSIADIATFGWTHIASICDFPFGHHKISLAGTNVSPTGPLSSAVFHSPLRRMVHDPSCAGERNHECSEPIRRTG